MAVLAKGTGSLADGFTLAAFAANPTRLEQDHGQGDPGIPPPVALPATHRVLQQ